MKAASKQREALEVRQKAWDNLPADGIVGNSKRVRHDNKTKSFIRPGSQNRKKGSSGKRSTKH